MNKEETLQKIEKENFKGKFPKRVCKLIQEEEFSKPLKSQQFIDMYNDGPGKNIKVGDLTSLFQPLLEKEIIKTKTLKEGKKKNKIWFPAWIEDNRISNELTNSLLKDLHPEIIKVSEKLFNDEHYAQAIEEAFKKIILLVKKKSNREDLDGCGLMTTVFSKENPTLKFNNLITRTDKDEQQGWMHLYQGAVLGIRDVKTHENIIQKDKQKAFEYLAFASLLCKRLEETTK
jgi:uncharacterized protein (TIGR02391 family)